MLIGISGLERIKGGEYESERACESVLKKREGRAEVDMAKIYHILYAIVDK